MIWVLESVQSHQKTVAKLTRDLRLHSQTLWRQVSANHIEASWLELLPAMKQQLAKYQRRAAVEGFVSTGLALGEQGHFIPSQAFYNVDSVLGYSSSGMPLDLALHRPVVAAKDAIAKGLHPGLALQQAAWVLNAIAGMQITDASRAAASVDIATKPFVGYVRMVGPSSCGRCIVLAGKFYRWNDGFLRHPQCNCAHVPATEQRLRNARLEGLIADPYDAFKGMSTEAQEKAFGKAGSEAIRDGSDIYQVTNAKRGVNGIYTTEGTAKTGYSSALKGRRLTPDGIYAQNLPREETLALLREHNYILPQGQVAGGSIRGQVEGYGALGRGGTRVGVRSEVERARATGVRNPSSRATMTAAERRLHDATARYGKVLLGQNPYSRNGTGLTPQLAAQAEAEYKRWLATGGQVFTS